jgi:3-hydroxyisobutyrate dehydrogenase-like beta-hydroxyacid dehydrogenase
LAGDSYLPQGFTLGLMRKDLQLALSLADDIGHQMPLGHLVGSFADDAIVRFGPAADQSQMMAEWFNA